MLVSSRMTLGFADINFPEFDFDGGVKYFDIYIGGIAGRGRELHLP